MITNLKFGKNEETFALLGKYIPSYDKDRAMSGIGIKLRCKEDCEAYAAELRIAIPKAQRDYSNLQKLKEKYNYTYPSKDKNCLSTPHQLYNTIKSTIIEIRESIKTFCPRNSHRAAGMYSSTTYTLKQSLLCNNTPYSKDFLPDTYPEYVKNLLGLLGEYMEIVENVITCSKELLDEEQRIRDDDELLKFIDQECRKDLEEFAIETQKSLGLIATKLTSADFEKRRKEAKNIKELRRQLYHAITPNDYKIRVFKDVMMRGMSNDLTVEESKIWTKEEDYEFVKIKVRRAIKAMVNNADLPKLKVANSEKYAIKAVYIASFMIWCHVGRAHYKDFIDYLTNQLKDALLQMPKYKSIMSALNNQQAKITSYFDDFEAFANT